MEASTQVCRDCKGSGKNLLTVETITAEGREIEKVEITCVRCDGKGEDIGKVFLEDIIRWCKCGKDWVFGSYPEDGECKCGVYKHHVHCGNCAGISQLG